MSSSAANAAQGTSELTPGSAFGSYDVVRCIGMGGMGAVYEATHRLMQRRVALKVLHSSIPTAGDIDPRERFLREGATLVRIEHPNVVEVYDAGVVGGRPYLAMELLEGSTLDRLILASGRLPPRRAVELIAGVADGLDAAHAVGIVHRDVKPENIFITTDAYGRELAKIVDFGIAKDFRATGGRNTAIGTPAYMSPEQLLGGRPIDDKCDQYALAATLYEALTGKRPYEASSLVELAVRLERGDAIPPTACGVPISGALDAAVMRGLAVDAEHRFESMAAFADALRGATTGGIAAPLGESPESRITAPPAAEMNLRETAAWDAPQVVTTAAVSVSRPAMQRPKPERDARRTVALALVAVVGVGLALGYAIVSRRDASAERGSSPAAASAPADTRTNAIANTGAPATGSIVPSPEPIGPSVETEAATVAPSPPEPSRRPRTTRRSASSTTAPVANPTPVPVGLRLER